MKNVIAIGLVKNINRFWSKIMIDCANEFSTSWPSTIPIIIGAGEKPALLKKNPTTPDINII
jgi:hypothetical protein